MERPVTARADRRPRCLHCGQPTREQIAAQAQLARAAIELCLDRLGWASDVALSRAVDRLLALEEAGAGP